MNQYRQGDVFIAAAATIPAGAVPVDRDHGRVVLAYGEVTGHAHAIINQACALLEDPETGRRWLIVEDGAGTLVDGDTVPGVALEHEEHGTVIVPPGAHEIRIQREYHPTAIRNVAD